MIHYEYVIILLAVVGTFAYLFGYGRGAKFTLDEFDRCFGEVMNKRKNNG